MIILGGGVTFLALAAVVGWRIQVSEREAQQQRCVEILSMIYNSKEQWAAENHASPEATPTWDQLDVYIRSAKALSSARCPSGGSYTIGRIRELPSCSIAEHQHAFEATVQGPYGSPLSRGSQPEPNHAAPNGPPATGLGHSGGMKSPPSVI